MPGSWATQPITWTPNQVVTDTQMNTEVRDRMLWLGGNLGVATAFTPTVSQPGSLTLSNINCRYFQVGKVVTGTINVTINSGGTSGNSIVIGALPIASVLFGVVGTGLYVRTAQSYQCVLQWASTTSFELYTGNQATNLSTGLGATPTIAAVVGDVIYATFVYEAA